MTLRQAVKKLGGPNRATTLYNLFYVGQRDSLGDPIEKLARSTLETWVHGISQTKATDVIKRMLDLADRPERQLDALYATHRPHPSPKRKAKAKPKPKGARRGKTQESQKAQAEARDVAR
jgi:hypothetical protein